MYTKKTSNKFSPEVRTRMVRMVHEHEADYPSQWMAIQSRPGAPYDRHTLAALIPEMEEKLGTTIYRIIADCGYRGHNTPSPHQFKVYIAGQKCRVTDAIRRELRRRPAVEPVIGHLKEDHRMGRNFLAHAAGDAINAILAAAGYNFRRILAWLKLLCAWFILLVKMNRQGNFQLIPA